MMLNKTVTVLTGRFAGKIGRVLRESVMGDGYLCVKFADSPYVFALRASNLALC